MIVEVDTTVVPATTRVIDADDFGRFEVRVLTSDHVWIAPEDIERLIPGGCDEAWREQFAGMQRYAESKSWVDESGRIRAHTTAEEIAT